MVARNKIWEDIGSSDVLTHRLKRTLYYSDDEDMDQPSLPLTELSVELFKEHDPKKLGKVDMAWASMISRRACVSPCAMMLGMIYLERLKRKKYAYLRSVSSSEIYLISMMVASKYLYDNGTDEEVFNDEWAESANMEVPDINQLERQFLNAMDWDLFVQPCHFETLLIDVERRIAMREGVWRGFFTYSDLSTLCDSDVLASVLNMTTELSSVALACSCAYAASLLSMALAPLVLHAVQCVASMGWSTLLPLLARHSTAQPFASHLVSSDVSPFSVHLAPSLEDLPDMTGVQEQPIPTVRVNILAHDLLWSSLPILDQVQHFFTALREQSKICNSQLGPTSDFSRVSFDLSTNISYTARAALPVSTSHKSHYPQQLHASTVRPRSAWLESAQTWLDHTSICYLDLERVFHLHAKPAVLTSTAWY